MFKSILKSAGGWLFDTGKAAVQGAAADRIGRFADRAIGIPTAGQMQADYLNRAFPGTTPWERLGSPSALGGVTQQVKKQEFRTRERVARIAADAQVKSAEITSRPAMQRAPFQNRYDAIRTQQVRRTIEPQIAKLKAEEKQLLASAFLLRQQGSLEEARTKLRHLLAAGDLSQKQFGSMRWFINALRDVGDDEYKDFLREADGLGLTTDKNEASDSDLESWLLLGLVALIPGLGAAAAAARVPGIVRAMKLMGLGRTNITVRQPRTGPAPKSDDLFKKQ